MKALTVLFGGRLAGEAFEPVLDGKSAFSLSLRRAAAFPGTEKIILLGNEGAEYPLEGLSCTVIRREWTVSRLLETLSEASAGFDFTYYAYADTPFLDTVLAGRLAERHCRFAADYSYADGWPLGFAPELLGQGLAGILYRIAEDAGNGPVERDTVFSVLQKDINSFDIETEISPVDLRCYRLNLAADSRRNLLLVRRLAEAGLSSADEAESIITEHPELLRTLPSFFSVQLAGPCPGTTEACAFCPYPESGAAASGFLDTARFGGLLDSIEAFAGDAALDFSLWGEISLHPECETLFSMALERPALSLIAETTGLGWKPGSAARIAAQAASSAPRVNGMAPLSWIVSLGAGTLPEAPAGQSLPEAAAFALELVSAFPKTKGGQDTVYVQTVRTRGAEDAVERFYRAWKKTGAGIIIQKYNSFCGYLPDRNAVDLSPLRRKPCWHIMRDMTILLDGGVPFCANACPQFWRGEDVLLGNAFTGSLESVWERGGVRYLEHCRLRYEGICAACDEYYTYNF